MELIKIKPLTIVSEKADCFRKLSRHPFYTRPNKLNITLTENKKYHVLISENGESFYSFEINAMLEMFNYELKNIFDIVLKEGFLSFKTIYGEYEVGEPIAVEL